MTIEWLVCILTLAGTLFYVLSIPSGLYLGPEKTRASYLRERKDAVYENLRDLNFEYKAGKLSEQDYAIQRAALEDEAAAILAEMEQIEKAGATTSRSPKTGLLGDPGAIVRPGTRRAGARPNGGRA